MSAEVATETIINDLELGFDGRIPPHDLYVGQLVTAQTVERTHTPTLEEDLLTLSDRQDAETSSEPMALLHVSGEITSIASPAHNRGDMIVIVQPEGDRSVPAVFLTNARLLSVGGRLVTAETVFRPYPAL